jgi:hypothetical protein
MRKTEIKLGIIFGILGFLFIILPILNIIDWVIEQDKPEPIVIYIKEVK